MSDSQNYLPSNDPELAQKAILQDFPDFKIESITSPFQGWDNHTFEVNGEWIFRFPKDGGFRFKSEQFMLTHLKNKVKLPIPVIEFVGKKTLFSAYRKIPGQLLKNWDAVSPAGKEHILDQLSDFQIQVHQSASPDKAEKLGITRRNTFPWIKPDECEKTINQDLAHKPWAPFSLAVLERYQSYLKSPRIERLMHRDLHGNNILVDSSSKKITGIIDFGDSLIGDIHEDFFSFSWIGRMPMMDLAEAYSKKTGIQLEHRRIRDYRALIYIDDLVNGFKDGKHGQLHWKEWDKEMTLWAEGDKRGQW